MKVLSQYRRFKRWWKLVVEPDNSKDGIDVKIPIFPKIKYNLLGFNDKEYVYYDLKNNDYHDYLCHIERNRLEDVNGRFAFFLGEKLMFPRTFGQYINIPQIICWIKDGRFVDLEGKGEEVDFISVLKIKGKIIAKPTRSCGGGKGVCAFSFFNNEFFIGEKVVDEELLVSEARSLEEFVFVEWIEQHAYSSVIFPKSTNTIRIITAMDEGKAEVLICAHRFGRESSAPVDNASSGGIFALIDEDTGALGKAKSYFTSDVYSVHPDSGEKLEGTVIPLWNDLLTELKQAHNCFPYYKFFAWDIVIGSDNKFYVLEINRGSGLMLYQMLKPQRNEKLGKWMKKNNLLMKW